MNFACIEKIKKFFSQTDRTSMSTKMVAERKMGEPAMKLEDLGYEIEDGVLILKDFKKNIKEQIDALNRLAIDPNDIDRSELQKFLEARAKEKGK